MRRNVLVLGMAKESAGLLMFRFSNGGLEVLLVHPGGPFWVHKDFGAWSIPKGAVDKGEGAMSAAKREFEEEVGVKPSGDFIELAPVRLKSGKRVRAWAFHGDCDTAVCTSNIVQLQWPPGSGKYIDFPEVDKAQFFNVAQAKQKLNSGQWPLIAELQALVSQLPSQEGLRALKTRPAACN